MILEARFILDTKENLISKLVSIRALAKKLDVTVCIQSGEGLQRRAFWIGGNDCVGDLEKLSGDIEAHEHEVSRPVKTVWDDTPNTQAVSTQINDYMNMWINGYFERPTRNDSTNYTFICNPSDPLTATNYTVEWHEQGRDHDRRTE